jgi:cellulose synthase/poly-beta-1,6-N-acetylglucosamine synthase-like glycosyltransferase
MGYQANIYFSLDLELPGKVEPLTDYDRSFLERIKMRRRGKKYGTQPHYHYLHPEYPAKQQEEEPSHYETTSFCILLLIRNQKRFDFFYSLQSVLKQNYENYRLIILDNASDDLTPKFMRRHILDLVNRKKKRVYLFGSKDSRSKGEAIFFGARKFCQVGEVLIVMEAG